MDCSSLSKLMTRWRPAYQKGAVVAPTSAMGWLARGVISSSAFLRWDDGGRPIPTLILRKASTDPLELTGSPHDSIATR